MQLPQVNITESRLEFLQILHAVKEMNNKQNDNEYASAERITSNSHERTSLIRTRETYRDGTNNYKPSLYRCCIRQFGFEWTRISFLYLVNDSLMLLNPLILREIVKDVQKADHERRLEFSIFLASLFLIVGVVEMLCFQHSQQLMLRLALKVKNSLTGAIYNKSLKLKTNLENRHTVGDVVNLVSVDCQRIQDSLPFSQAIMSVSFLVAIGLYMLWEPMKMAFVGCIFGIILIVSLSVIFGRLKGTFYKTLLTLKSKRIRLLDEILKGIKLIKMYTWEPYFMQKVQSVREEEINILRKSTFVVSGDTVLTVTSPFLLNLIMVGVFTLVDDQQYGADRAFYVLSVISIFTGPLLLMPLVVSGITQAYISIGRINTFLHSPELDARGHNAMRNDSSVTIENGYFTWHKTLQTNTLKRINLQIKRGELVAIVGFVGSGKTSLLASILGEIDKVKGRVDIQGSIAYVKQEAWIQNMTIRENILFGKPYNETKFQHIINQCCLKPDLQMLPAMDQTEIGERGVNLSGGQKQRINIARAVYSDADIYLFDDPLSSVDSHVGKNLFQNVIGPNGILKGKTRILVTHGVRWLPEVQKIIVMNNGEITEQGTFDQLVTHDGSFSKFLKTHFTIEDGMENDDTQSRNIKTKMFRKPDKDVSDGLRNSPNSDAFILHRSVTYMTHKNSNDNSGTSYDKVDNPVSQTESNGKLTDIETTEMGPLKMNVLSQFVLAMGLPFIILATVLLFISYGLGLFSNFWIKFLTTDIQLQNKTCQETDKIYSRNAYYFGIYVLIGLCQGVSFYLFDIFLLNGFVNASSNLHKRMLNSLSHSPLSFFDTTPTGRIINRFASDIDIIDERFRRYANFLIVMLATLLTIIIAICIILPWSIIVILPCLSVYLLLIKWYLPTARQLKRLEAVTRSPVFSHINETITGNSVIRAFRSEGKFLKELYRRLDINSSFYYATNIGIGWIGIRVEIFGILIIFTTALFTSLSPSIDGADAGLSLSYALQIVFTMNSVVQALTVLQMDVISIERIREYTELEPEAQWQTSTSMLPATWPRNGHLQFIEYKTRYRACSNMVLKGINVEIKGGEKVGVVGRTGAGKSTLALAIFRLIEKHAGVIKIDVIDIASLGLHDLRSRLAILPQDPVIFSESLRHNLDPKCQFTDNDIWTALEHVNLKKFLTAHKITLNELLEEKSGFLSFGQKQLLCLARTLLHKKKILILDEATAAVDLETDALIQETIRSRFSDCTVLSIAHRVDTVLHYDRILVMDEGLVQQFGSPDDLLRDRTGLFYLLAKEAGILP